MADSVTKALMLDKIPIDGKSVLLVQYNDGSPFLHHLLCHNARLSRKMCLISFKQNVGYYHSVGSRLGWNLNNQLSKGQFSFLGGLQTLSDAFDTTDTNNPFRFVFQHCSPLLSNLISAVQTALSGWKDEAFTLVIDDVDCLFNMGIPFKDVVMFYQHCHSIVHSSGSKGSLVVSVSLSPSDIELVRFSSLLSHWSDLVLTEKGLQTGVSKELGGSLAIHWNVTPFTQQVYHFKCFDRGIKMFAPGTAVL